MTWAKIPFKKVLTYLDERIELQDMAEYLTITVKRGHGGLEEREKLFGHQIKTKKQFRLIPGSFIISRVQCWHQAYAMVPVNLPSNMIASTNYDQFAISSDVNPRFFWWLSHSPTFTESVRSSAPGVVIEKMVFNREAWLEKTIPIPPLPEQRRIVGKIEGLAAKIGEARSLRGETYQEARTLMGATKNSVFGQSHHRWINKSLEEVAPINMGQSPPGHSYNTHGEGIPLLNGPTEFGDCNPIPIQWTSASTKLCNKGDILLCVRGATTGRMNWADREYCIGRGLAALTVDTNICDPRFVYHFVENQTHEMLSLSAGSTFPNLPGAKLKSLQIPVPTQEEQRRIVAYLEDLQAQVDALKKLQAQTAVELDALLPAILDRAFKGEL